LHGGTTTNNGPLGALPESGAALWVRRSLIAMANKKWADLTPAQKTVILTLASIELSLTATAAADLARRPAAQVHGRKGLWALALFVQPVGPVAYLWTHRR